ncbi:efflux transporter outer membrane subunit [Nisaea acidiphila]|uniref:Efflux transporter outer membrane subunit n=1 Tax=Nisaea acidiphila TaxID=1862145 RepID=A0A9J7AV06_9PROT|nr:efflux transporter outer membrane subunit [Nisaea acidiphila]UUX51587.1 efflux transporter outer membrane subunit [Nisaea acidiphila]
MMKRLPKGAAQRGPQERYAAGRRAGLVLAVLMLGGCTVGPEYRVPALSLPTDWGTESAAARETAVPELSRWWTELDDPTLNGLIERASGQNLDLAAARARIREARASYRQAGGALQPSLDGSGSTGLAGSDNSIDGQFQAGFDASWELDIFGGRKRRVEAAAYGVGAAEEDLRDTMLTLIGDIASNYVSARSFRARIDLARRTAISMRETESLTRARFRAGATAASDMANAAGQASSTEANIPALEVSFAEAVHRLGVLTGQAPGALAAMLRNGAPIPRPTRPIPTGVPADILLTRPDVRGAERELARYTALIGEAEAARYPSVSLTGSIATSGTSIGDLAKGSSIGWAIGPSLTVPIFNGGQLEAAVDLARAQRDQFEAAFRSTVLTALEDVENAIVALAQERIRNRSLAEASESYREAARLARSLYGAGSISFLDVLDAERSLYSAEDALLQSTARIATGYVTLNKALGGGWDGVLETAAAAPASG